MNLWNALKRRRRGRLRQIGRSGSPERLEKEKDLSVNPSKLLMNPVDYHLYCFIRLYQTAS